MYGTEDDGDGRAGNLPAELTRLVGREQALAELSGLLGQTRLLTLTGPGGAGKSRLGLALAGALQGELTACAWWVELAALGDPGLVAELVAMAVGAARPPAGGGFGSIARRLGDRPALLVLDNCERVSEGCAELAGALLSACPALRVLATSRRPLGVPGEQVWRVPGLSLPGEPAGSGALELFVERARQAAPGFALDADAAEAAARLCVRLDGMPLAIELAAARVSVLGVREIADRLERDIGFLRQGGASVPARHQSLHATLDWSHAMLAPTERALLRRLSVFAGSFSLEAAEAVCAGGDVHAPDVLDRLGRLIDHSLVQVSERAGETRYRLLDTVRQYADQRLVEAGERPACRDRHARFYLELAAGDRSPGLERIAREHDNLRAALRRQLESAPELAGRLAGVLWPFWYRRGYYHEARLRLEEAVAIADRMPPAARVQVLTGAGVLAFLQCDYAVAGERLRKALRLNRELGDRRGVATALQRLGSIAREQGRYAEARELHEQSLAVWRELGDRSSIAASQDYLGFAAWLAGDFDAAEGLSGEALAIFQATGELPEAASALINLGAAASGRGEQRLAQARLEEALAISRRAGFQEGVAWSLHELAIVARRRHHPAQAAGLLRESLVVHGRLGDRWRVASVLEEIAGGLLARLDPRRAAELLAAAGALRDRLGTPLPPAERADHERAVAVVRGRLSRRALEEASAHGAALGVEAAIDLALEGLARLYGGSDAPRAVELTARERAVLRLLSQGHTNREIGAELFISASTAGVHVSNILRKLGVRRRAEAAAEAQRRGLLGDAA